MKITNESRTVIGVVCLTASILGFGWYGLLSLVFVLPFIGWNDRHKGPFMTTVNRSVGKMENEKSDSLVEYRGSLRKRQNTPSKDKCLAIVHCKYLSPI